MALSWESLERYHQQQDYNQYYVLSVISTTSASYQSRKFIVWFGLSVIMKLSPSLIRFCSRFCASLTVSSLSHTVYEHQKVLSFLCANMGIIPHCIRRRNFEYVAESCIHRKWALCHNNGLLHTSKVYCFELTMPADAKLFVDQYICDFNIQPQFNLSDNKSGSAIIPFSPIKKYHC